MKLTKKFLLDENVNIQKLEKIADWINSHIPTGGQRNHLSYCSATVVESPEEPWKTDSLEINEPHIFVDNTSSMTSPNAPVQENAYLYDGIYIISRTIGNLEELPLPKGAIWKGGKEIE